MKLIKTPAYWQCPYCLKPVGLLGRGLAWFFGTRFHGCDFHNLLRTEDRK